MPKISEKIVNLRDLQRQVRDMREQLTELGYQLDRIDDKFARNTENFGITMRYVSEFNRAAAAIDNTLNKALPRLHDALHQQQQVDNETKHNLLKELLNKFFKQLDTTPGVTHAVLQGVARELKETDKEAGSELQSILALSDPGPGHVDWVQFFKDNDVLHSKPKTLELFNYLAEVNWRELNKNNNAVIEPGPVAFKLPSDVPQIKIGIDNDSNTLLFEVKGATQEQVKQLQQESHDSYHKLHHSQEQNWYRSVRDRLGPIEYWFRDSDVEANHELENIGGLRKKTINALKAGHIHFPYQLLDRVEPYEPRFKHFRQPINQIKGIGKRVILELQYALIKFGIERHGLDLFTSRKNIRNPELLPREELLTECLLTAGVEHFRNSDVDPNKDRKKTLKRNLGDYIELPLNELVLPDYPLDRCFTHPLPEEAQWRRCDLIPKVTNDALESAWWQLNRDVPPALGVPEWHPTYKDGKEFEALRRPTEYANLDVLQVLSQIQFASVDDLCDSDDIDAQIILAEYFGWKSILGISKQGRTWYEDQFDTKPWMLIQGKAIPVNRLLDLDGPDPKWYKKEENPF